MSCTVDVVHSILAADRGLNVEIDCASCIKDFAARESDMQREGSNTSTPILRGFAILHARENVG